LQYAHLYKKSWLFNFDTSQSKTSSISDNYASRNFEINNYSVGPKISYLFNSNVSLSIIYEYKNKENSINNLEQLKQQRLGATFTYSGEKKITINGVGNQLRSYMYVTDAAEAAVKAATSKKAKNQILNIGNGSEKVTLVKLVKLISKIICSKKDFLLDKKFKNTDRSANREIYKRYCSSKKAQHLLKWKPKVKLIEGIRLASEEI
jgi:nucleoside-diphosphate-sugar epimerase